jgi:hypothetical protein
MSSVISINGKIVTFSEYLLSESIRPKNISYGLNKDTNDSKIYNKGGITGTLFLHPKSEYGILVAIVNKEAVFGIYDKDLHSNFNDIIEVLSDRNERGTAPGLKICSHVFYVILELLKITKDTELFFDASNRDLGRVYDYLVKNKYFIEELDKIGFTYKEDSKYKFKRK